MLYADGPKGALANNLPRIIYVEGQDDAWFIDALLEELGADSGQVGIVYIEGNGKVVKELKFLVRSGSFVQRRTTDVAFILDADESAAQATARLHAALLTKNLPTPASGEIVSFDNGRKLGVFIMPDGRSGGAIEELLVGTLGYDARWDIVSNALDAVEQKFGILDHRIKRQVRMHISTLPIKPCGIGRAYCQNVFDRTHPDLNPIRDFVQAFIS